MRNGWYCNFQVGCQWLLESTINLDGTTMVPVSDADRCSTVNLTILAVAGS